MKTVLFEDLVSQKIDNRGKTPPIVDAGFPLLEVNSITRNSINPNVSKATKFVNQDTWENWFRQHLEEDDVLFTTVGTIAESAIVPKNPGYAVAQNILGFRFNKKEINPLYALYLMRSKWFLDQIAGRTIETVQKSIKWSDMRGIKIPLPDIDEQQKISCFVGQIDKKIELNRCVNEVLEKIGQALFKHYFIDNLEAKAWPKEKMGEVVNIKGGGTPSTKNADFWYGEIAWTSPRDLTGKKDAFLLDTDKTITQAGLAKVSSGLLPKGTLLLSSRAPIGYVAIAGLPLAINQGYIAFLPDGKLSNYFMYFWLKQNMDRIKGAANGSTFMEISKAVFRGIETKLPDEESLREFARTVEPSFEAMRSNQQEIASLTKLRDSLLPRLISGKIKA